MSLSSAHKFTSVCTLTPTHSYITHTHGHTNTHTLEGSYKTRGWAEIRRLERERGWILGSSERKDLGICERDRCQVNWKLDKISLKQHPCHKDLEGRDSMS